MNMEIKYPDILTIYLLFLNVTLIEVTFIKESTNNLEYVIIGTGRKIGDIKYLIFRELVARKIRDKIKYVAKREEWSN